MAHNKQQQHEPGRTVILYHCLPVALVGFAFFPLRVRVSRKDPQQNQTN